MEIEVINEYLQIYSEEERIVLYFDIEQDKPLVLGDRINEINDDAYMNGYNWEILLKFYFSIYNPSLITEMETDPEAGAFYAIFPNHSQKDYKKVLEIANYISSFVENESSSLEFIKKRGNDIAWD